MLSRFSHVQICAPYELQPTRFLCLWDFPGKNTEVGYPALLQGICPSQGWNPHLPESLALHYLWLAPPGKLQVSTLQTDSLPSEAPGKLQALNMDLTKTGI